MFFARVTLLFKSLGTLSCINRLDADSDVTVGCTIKKLSFNELKERGLPDVAGEKKRAVLKVPLEFPKTRIKRARR